MSNSNIEPMPFRRQFGGGANANGHTATSRTLADLAAAVSVPQDEDAFVDVSGLAKVRQIVTGACRKCGFPGHLPFQCRNYIQLKPGQSTVIDVSSTSSESETETPLVKKHKKKHKKKDSKKEKKEKKDKKKKKEKKRRRHSSSSDSDDDRHRKKKKEKKKRKRKHSTSSSSSSSSDDDRKSKKKKKRD